MEEIDGNGRCSTYLYRWTLFQPRRLRWLWRGFGVYLHKFVGDDWSRDMHDHPKRFVSIGLRGGYIEETPDGSREYVAPWVRSFPAHHIHRIRLPAGGYCWTLVIVLRAVRAWGFWHDGQWVPWREYVQSDTAKEMRSCP